MNRPLRILSGLALGVLLGVGMPTGCCNAGRVSLLAGTYDADHESLYQYEHPTLTSDSLVISPDLSSVVETRVLNSKTYVIKYKVVSKSDVGVNP